MQLLLSRDFLETLKKFKLEQLLGSTASLRLWEWFSTSRETPAFCEKKLHADLSSPASNSSVSPKKGAGAGSPHPQWLLLISNRSVQLQPQKKKLKDVAGAPLPSHGGPQDTRGRKGRELHHLFTGPAVYYQLFGHAAQLAGQAGFRSTVFLKEFYLTHYSEVYTSSLELYTVESLVLNCLILQAKRYYSPIIFFIAP